MRYVVQVRDEQDAAGEWRDTPLNTGSRQGALDAALGANSADNGETFRVFDREAGEVVR